MRHLISAMLVVVGVIHLLPLSGVFMLIAAFRPLYQLVALIAGFARPQ